MQRATFLCGIAASAATAGAGDGASTALAALENHTGGRLGVYAVDTGTGASLAHRAGERFPMCSTFKMLLVAAVLQRVDRGADRLSRSVAYGQRDLLAYAPVTRANVARGSLTLGQLCSAALVYSDNTAANLLLATAGGPRAVTRFARSLGDPFTRLDRNEPALNEAIPGDPRDTTTPRAMSADWRTLLSGPTLTPASRTFLEDGLIQCKTGTNRIRAGIPKGWRAGDKTGSGSRGTGNDVAVLYPPARAPIYVAAYLTGATVDAGARDEALATVGRIVASTFGR